MFSKALIFGIERIALEDHRDVTVARSHPFWSCPSMRIRPPSIGSSPASIRRVVDLPQPDGPDEDEELAIGDLEGDLVDGRHLGLGVLRVASSKRSPSVSS
jgi:hypothetical protein